MSPTLARDPSAPPLVRALLSVLDASGRHVVATHRLGPQGVSTAPGHREGADAPAEEAAGAGGRAGRHRLTVGRSMACDVVVADPHVAAEHFTVSLDEHGALIVRDLGTVNGTRVDKAASATSAASPAAEHTVRDEQVHTIVAGRTRFTLRGQAAQVAAEVPLDAHAALAPSHDLGVAGRPVHEPPALLAALGRARRLWTMVALVSALAVFAQWLETSWQREALMQVVGGTLGVLTAAGFWLALWALVGRVVAGRPRWAVQAGVLAAITLVFVLGREAVDLVSFATSGVLPSIVDRVWGTLGFVVLLYAHLRVSTHLRARHVLPWAAVLPAAVLGLTLWQTYGSASGREWRQTDGAALYPPAWRIVRPADTAALIADARDLERRAVERMKASRDDEAADGDDDEAD